MKLNIARTFAGAGLVALAALGSAAQARDNVYWSLGVEAAPGVTLGLGNARPVYVAPAPVYVAPRPVIVHQPPVYYVRPAPVVVEYYDGHRGKHKGHRKHHRHHRHWD